MAKQKQGSYKRRQWTVKGGMGFSSTVGEIMPNIGGGKGVSLPSPGKSSPKGKGGKK